MKKIAIYLRLSLADVDLGADGKEESNSIENQRLMIRNYLKAHEEIIGDVVEYKDDGYTGLNFDRPAFRQMIEDARNGIIGTIIVKDLSRFGRDYIGVGDYMEQILPSLGVRLIAINSRYDSKDHDSNGLSIEVSINNMINNMYSRDISKKIRSVMAAQWRDGKNPSGIAPFGYYVKKGDPKHKLRIDKKAAEVVRLIYDYALEGRDTRQIVEHLNQCGYATPMRHIHDTTGKAFPSNATKPEERLWTTSMVAKIIQRYDYTGARVHGMMEPLGVCLGKRKPVDRHNWVIVENDHEPIVTKEEYELAQLVIRTPGEPMKFSGKEPWDFCAFKCGCCGCKLQILDLDQRYLYCQHSMAVGNKSRCCKAKYPATFMKSTVLHSLNCQIAWVDFWNEKLREETKGTMQEISSDISCIEQELSEMKEDFVRKYESFANANISREEFLDYKSTYTQKREDLTLKKEKLSERKSEDETLLFDSDRIIKLGDLLFDDKKKFNQAIKHLIKEVIVYDTNHIEVKYAFADLYERLLQRASEIIKA